MLREDINFINKFLYSVQKHRIMLSNWMDAKKRDGIESTPRQILLYEALEKQENIAKKMARDIVEMTPIWAEFFENTKGVAECLATSLLAEIGDIKRFGTVSKLWAYAGLLGGYYLASCENGHKLILSSDHHKTCPVFSNENDEPCSGLIKIDEHIEGQSPKRKKGYHFLFNGNLKTICWKVAEQMRKQGDDYYKKIYYGELEKQGYVRTLKSKKEETDPDKYEYTALPHAKIPKMHAMNRANRKVMKRFLSHLWEAWTALEGGDVRPPYVIEKLGHQGYVKWADLKQQIAETREKIKKVS